MKAPDTLEASARYTNSGYSYEYDAIRIRKSSFSVQPQLRVNPILFLSPTGTGRACTASGGLLRELTRGIFFDGSVKKRIVAVFIGSLFVGCVCVDLRYVFHLLQGICVCVIDSVLVGCVCVLP